MEKKKTLPGKTRTSTGKLANKTKQGIFASVISFVKSGSWILGMSLLLGWDTPERVSLKETEERVCLYTVVHL